MHLKHLPKLEHIYPALLNLQQLAQDIEAVDGAWSDGLKAVSPTALLPYSLRSAHPDEKLQLPRET